MKIFWIFIGSMFAFFIIATTLSNIYISGPWMG